MTPGSAAADGAAGGGPRVLVVDNFDSFTYNLVEYLSLHASVEVRKNTASLADVRSASPDAIVLSPGPGHPANERDVGVTIDVLREVSPSVPTLGVCLGLEAAVHAYGGRVGRAPEPVHGRAVPVDHDGRGVFAGLGQGLPAGRYHSLVATAVPDCFAVTATARAEGAEESEESDDAPATDDTSPATGDGASGTGDGGPETGDGRLVMGVRHRDHPIECVQFHPESVLTPDGHAMVENFLASVR